MRGRKFRTGARKKLGGSKTRAALYDLHDILTLLNVVDVGKIDCIKALGLPIKDFEDALLSVCAGRADADYIASRDKEFINSASIIPVKESREILALNKP